MLDIIFGLWYIVFPLIGLGIFAAILMLLYTIVPANFADVVVQRGKTRVFSSDKKYSKAEKYSSEGKAAYYKVPSFIPGVGMEVHNMSLEIQPINVPDFKAFDIDRARFLCDIMAYIAISDPVEAAKRFGGNMRALAEQVSKVVQATTRDSTTKKTIREIINDREGIIKEIKDPLSKAIANWGLSLKDIELVEFKDAEGTHVISDISSIIEEQINSEARQKNAEQKKIARVKEADAEELAKKRELKRDEEIGKRDKVREQEVAKEAKKAMEEQLEVTKVDKVKNQRIEKEKAEVKAEQDREVAKIDAQRRKEVEAIIKVQKQLEGEGDKIKQQEQAKGEAAPIREVGTAEADIILKKWEAEAKGKDKLADALSKFGYNEIQALIAELVVDKDKTVGVALAEALAKADMKVFAGNGAKDGFDLGKLVESINISSPDTANAVVHKLGKPNDLGFEKGFAVGNEAEKKKAKKDSKPTEKTKSTGKHLSDDFDTKQAKKDSAADKLKKISEGKKSVIETKNIGVRM